MSASRASCPPSLECPRCSVPALPANMHGCHECGGTDCDGCHCTEDDACSAGRACDDQCCDGWQWLEETELECPGCKRALRVVVDGDVAYLHAEESEEDTPRTCHGRSLQPCPSCLGDA